MLAEGAELSLLPAAERWDTMPAGLPRYSLGYGALKWGMTYLRQPDGDNAGERWKFTPSQAKFLLWYYSLEGPGSAYEGSFTFSHAVRRLPKGAGKSPFAAVMSLMELCAPVRFKGWELDPANPGDVRAVGKRVGMPLVQIAATAQEQGMINTMRMVRALIAATKADGSVDYTRKSRLELDYGLDVGKTLIYTPGGGQLSVITSSANAAEGALTTFGICDQTEAWGKSNGGHDLFQVMDRNAAKSKSRLVQTANSWQPGADSVAEQTFDAWVAEQEGRTRGRAKTLMDVRMAPPWAITYNCVKEGCDEENCKHRGKEIDRDLLIDGVKYAYGDCYWADPEDIVDRHILDPKTPLDVSKRFYLNWPTVAEDAWIEPYEWRRWGKPELVLPEGAEIALGFDGSRTRDASGLIACEISTGNVFDLGIWETQNGHGSTDVQVPVPVAEVDAAVERAFSTWNVVIFLADVREWESFTKVEWPKRYASQLKTWASPGGRDPQPIAWDMRVHVSDFTAAAEMVQEEITGDSPVFFHDGSGILSRHVANTRGRPNRFGVSVGKESPDSPKKIDGCVTMIIARHARRLYLAQLISDAQKNKGRKQPGAAWSTS